MHDHVALYRAWHHSPLRAPTHTIITILTITLAGITLANIARQAPAQAATGIFAEFPFQGRLTNSDGTVVGNGSYDAVFKLYTVDTGGVPLWTESHTGANKITATDGVFSTMLGSLNSLSGIDFNQDQYWLGITVGTDSEMTPRIRLGSAPYAFNSDKLDGVSSEAFLQLPGQAGGQTAYGGTAASENLVLRSTSHATKGSIILGDDGVTPIGVGLADPFQSILGGVSLGGGGIHVDTGSNVARVLLEGNDPSYEIINNTAAANQKWTELFQSTSGYFGIFTRDDAGVRLQPSNANPAFAVDNSTGYAAVGTANPDAKFTVDTSSTSPAANALNVKATWNSGGTYDANNTIITDTASGGFSTLMSALRTDGVNTLTSYAIGKNGILMAGSSTGVNDMRINVQGYNSTATAGTSISLDRHRGTFASPLAVSDGDKLGSLDFRAGYTTSSATADAAQIIAEVDGTPGGSTDMPGRLVFKTTPDGSGTLATRLTVSNAGNLVLGSGALTTSATDGFLYLASMAGVPTGTPSTNSGRVPLAYNTASNILYAYNSGWQAINGGGSGITGSGAAGRVTVWSGASAVTSDGEFLYDTTTNALSLGSTPATSGLLRLPNNQALTARNTGNTADIPLIYLNTSDGIQFGATSTNRTDFDFFGGSSQDLIVENSFGGPVTNLLVEGGLAAYDANGFSTPAATSGPLRIPNNKYLTARNSTNSSDVSVIGLNTNDQIAFGFTSSNTVTFDLNSSSDTNLNVANNTGCCVTKANLNIEGALSVYNANGFGATVASAGHIRLPNNASLSARNVGNTGDVDLLKLNSSDRIELGQTSTNTSTLDIPSSSNSTLQIENAHGCCVTKANVAIEGALLVYDSNGFGGSPSTTGHIRLPNNASFSSRNVGNTDDVAVIKLNTSDHIEFGATASNATVLSLPGSSNTDFYFENDTGCCVTKSNVNIEGALRVYDANGFGGTASTTGHIRLPNNASLSARNVGNTADVALIKLNTSDLVEVGGSLTLSGGDYYDTTIPSSVSSTTLCISGGGQIGTCTSDARLKTNIQDIGSGLDVIEQLSPKTFDFISGQTNQSGFLAQEVQQILPGAVTKDTGDDYLSLNYSNITAYAVKAIQELNQRIDELPVGTALSHKKIIIASLTADDIAVKNSASLGSLHVVGSVVIDGTLLVQGSATFSGDLAIAGDLTISGSIKGSKQTRGFNIKVPEASATFTQDGLELPTEGAYSVSVLPSWLTSVSISKKGIDSFTVDFSVPAPANATIDYQIQE